MESPPQDAQSAFPPPTGLALASLLLGIAAVGLSFLVIGLVLGVIGAALGYSYLRAKRGPKRMAHWGIGLSFLGILVSIGFALLYYYFINRFNGSIMGGGSSVTVTGVSATASPLPVSKPLLNSNLVWSVKIPGAHALCAGDWESDGSQRVLVAARLTLHVLDLTGAETSTLPLPEHFTAIECGRNKTSGARLLGYTTTGVTVIDHAGKKVWSENALMGMNGAHWGDLTGDGTDAMIIGMNGFGGLEALSGEGRKLWSVNMANVWSQAIVPAVSNHPALVVATDASGAINLLDAAGKRLNSLRADPGYYTQMTAGLTESNEPQILAFNGNTIEALDQSGKAAWSTPANANFGSKVPCAVMGDFKGDGSKQWAFLNGAGDLEIATTGGLKVSSVPNRSQIQGLAVAPRKGQGALLLILDGGAVKAYSFGP